MAKHKIPHHDSPYRGERRITGDHISTLKRQVMMLQGHEVSANERDPRNLTDIIKIAECLASGEWEIVRK